jgi:hypothetical protein
VKEAFGVGIKPTWYKRQHEYVRTPYHLTRSCFNDACNICGVYVYIGRWIQNYANTCTASAIDRWYVTFSGIRHRNIHEIDNQFPSTHRSSVCVLTGDRSTGADEVRVEEIPNKEGNSSTDASVVEAIGVFGMDEVEKGIMVSELQMVHLHELVV